MTSKPTSKRQRASTAPEAPATGPRVRRFPPYDEVPEAALDPEGVMSEELVKNCINIYAAYRSPALRDALQDRLLIIQELARKIEARS